MPEVLRKIQLLEMAIFPTWVAASEEKRLEITEKLGRLEGQLIIDEICSSVTKSIST